MLRDALLQVVQGYSGAIKQDINNHPLAAYLRHGAPTAVRDALGSLSPSLNVQGSAGSGRWGDIPWVTVMDPRVTDTPTRGYYIVYLFNWRDQKVVLSLNQGSSQVRKDYGAKRNAILAERALRMRDRAGQTGHFSATPIHLNAVTDLGRSYEPGHALGRTYDAHALPTEEELVADLLALASMYATLFNNGGVDAPATEEEVDEVSEERPQAVTLNERRIYRTHRRIERRPGNARQVKSFHGYRCQACGMKFDEIYGGLGERYIEAHHLVPLASLAVGASVSMNVSKDFCVLCANCHRMIHRQDDPSDLEALRALLVEASE